ncbi:polyhydroxyalkanoate synthase [Rhodococcus rhodochrous J45]|uniref:Polyhydroxyalkanoate synthase n=1 Tax=Rhodococcus rhodochrous J45 TaxID=935266 RepID=A0A562DJQ1_RHORH|nr:alpha/beta hydrolase [Rhodococcus rhodochrous]TWH09880.1 polyhydroxyalkanoate synthase [Rhodococcus rhodochrous J45]
MGITDVVGEAARNAWSLFVADGIAPPHHTPSVVVGDGRHRTLRRFGPENAGPPVLLVTPLAASPTCFDLMPGQSLVEHLLELGRSVFLVEYGEMTSDDRDLGLEFWIDEVIPEAIARTSELCGNREVDVVAWSIGGTLAMLTAAAHPDLPMRSLTAFGSPLDYSAIPLMALPRLVGRFVAEPALGLLDAVFGGVPAPIVRTAYRLTAIEREIQRPWFVATHLADAETLARMERVDRFQDEIHGYAGRVFHQLATNVTVDNQLATGRLHLGDRVVDLADVTVPVLAFGGEDDVLAPIPAVEPVTRLLVGTQVRFVRVPGTHLGMLTGSAARDTSWVELDAFLREPTNSNAPAATLPVEQEVVTTGA